MPSRSKNAGMSKTKDSGFEELFKRSSKCFTGCSTVACTGCSFLDISNSYSPAVCLSQFDWFTKRQHAVTQFCDILEDTEQFGVSHFGLYRQPEMTDSFPSTRCFASRVRMFAIASSRVCADSLLTWDRCVPRQATTCTLLSIVTMSYPPGISGNPSICCSISRICSPESGRSEQFGVSHPPSTRCLASSMRMFAIASSRVGAGLDR